MMNRLEIDAIRRRRYSSKSNKKLIGQPTRSVIERPLNLIFAKQHELMPQESLHSYAHLHCEKKVSGGRLAADRVSLKLLPSGHKASKLVRHDTNVVANIQQAGAEFIPSTRKIGLDVAKKRVFTEAVTIISSWMHEEATFIDPSVYGHGNARCIDQVTQRLKAFKAGISGSVMEVLALASRGCHRKPVGTPNLALPRVQSSRLDISMISDESESKGHLKTPTLSKQNQLSKGQSIEDKPEPVHIKAVSSLSATRSFDFSDAVDIFAQRSANTVDACSLHSLSPAFCIRRSHHNNGEGTPCFASPLTAAHLYQLFSPRVPKQYPFLHGAIHHPDKNHEIKHNSHRRPFLKAPLAGSNVSRASFLIPKLKTIEYAYSPEPREQDTNCYDCSMFTIHDRNHRFLTDEVAHERPLHTSNMSTTSTIRHPIWDTPEVLRTSSKYLLLDN